MWLTPRRRRYGTSARTSAKVRPGPSCSRYVASSSLGNDGAPAPEHEQRARLDLAAAQRRLLLVAAVLVAGGQHDRPAAAEALVGQPEVDVLVAGVEQQQERVVDDRRAVGRDLPQLVAVEEHAEDVVVGALPVALGH